MSVVSAASAVDCKPMDAQASELVMLHRQKHRTTEEFWGLGARYDWPVALDFMKNVARLTSGQELAVPYPVAAQVIKIRYTVATTDDGAAQIFNANNECFGAYHFLPAAHMLVGSSHYDSMNHDWRFTAGGGATVQLRTDNWPVVFLSILHDLARHAQHNDWATRPSHKVVYAIRGLRIFIEGDEEYSGRGEQVHKRVGIRPLSIRLMTVIGQTLEYPSAATYPWQSGAGDLLRDLLHGAKRHQFLTAAVSSEQQQEGKVDAGEREERLLRTRTARACSKAFEFWEAYWTAYTTKYPQAHAAASLAKSSARSAFTPVARAQQF